jgi:hypothetical protein
MYGVHKEAKQIKLSASSVIDLKAELLEKTREYERSKLQPPKKKNKELEYKQTKKDHPVAVETELERSWLSLERKSKLYQKLEQEGGLESDDDDHLVDFLAKPIVADSSPSVSGDWIKVVDEFGRDRLVRKSKVAESTPRQSPVVEEAIFEPARQNKHFSSKSERRTLGTGFYQFSDNLNQRAEQMNELNKLRKDTIQNRAKAVDPAEKRKRRLDDRMKLIQNKQLKKVQSKVDEIFDNLRQ